MKKLMFGVGVAAVLLGVGCWEKTNDKQATGSGTVVRIHSLGAADLAQNTNAAKLKRIGSLASSRELREQALEKLARTPYDFWRNQLPSGAENRPALIRPLLDDLISAETFLEVRGPKDRTETALAIEINDERARLWSTNLWQLMLVWKTGNPSTMKVGDFGGWEARQQKAPYTVQFIRAGKWVVIGWGQDRLPLSTSLLDQAAKSGRPLSVLSNSWMEVDADFPRLRTWFPGLAKYKLPQTTLTLRGKDEYLRTQVQLNYSEPVPWSFEPWRIPTNSIHDPINSFTVGQGIGSVLGEVKGISDLGLKTLPNQFCVWGQSSLQNQTLAAVPLPGASELLPELAAKLGAFARLHMPRPLGDFAINSNKTDVFWRGLPFIIPTMWASRESGTDFLIASLYPKMARTNLPPPELFAQFMGRRDLLYYDWEITQERLIHSRQLSQLLDIINRRKLAVTNMPTQKWLLEVAPHLGNTATEITRTSSKELTLTRKSHIGFTGFELVMLTRWLDSSGFPLSFEPPPPIFGESKTNSPTPKLQTNAPARKKL